MEAMVSHSEVLGFVRECPSVRLKPIVADPSVGFYTMCLLMIVIYKCFYFCLISLLSNVCI